MFHCFNIDYYGVERSYLLFGILIAFVISCLFLSLGLRHFCYNFIFLLWIFFYLMVLIRNLLNIFQKSSEILVGLFFFVVLVFFFCFMCMHIFLSSNSLFCLVLFIDDIYSFFLLLFLVCFYLIGWWMNPFFPFIVSFWFFFRLNFLPEFLHILTFLSYFNLSGFLVSFGKFVV